MTDLLTTPRPSAAPTRVGELRRRVAGRTSAWWLHATERRPAWLARLAPLLAVSTPAARFMALFVLLGAVAIPWLGWSELVVGVVLCLVLLAVAVWFVVGTYRLSASLGLTSHRVVVGERAHGRLVVTNVSTRRTSAMSIELPVGQGRAELDLPALPAGEAHEELFVVPTARRAVLQVGPVTAVRADPLGLLRRDERLTDADLLYVHPRTVRLDGSATGLIRDLEGRTVPRLTDHDMSFHALRPYVAGDDRRSIHWKSTARTGQLMVRQYEETRRSHLMVLLSTRLDDYADEDEFETAVSVAGSLGVQALAEGQSLSAFTSTAAVRTETGRAFLDQLSGLDFDRGAPPLESAVRRASREASGASVAVLIAGSLARLADVRRARRHVPLEVRTIAIRPTFERESIVRPVADVHVADVADLDDLPGVMRRLVA